MQILREIVLRTDDDINIRDREEAIWALTTRVDAIWNKFGDLENKKAGTSPAFLGSEYPTSELISQTD